MTMVAVMSFSLGGPAFSKNDKQHIWNLLAQTAMETWQQCVKSVQS